jgi:wyosine [tRNA(Phe)-imidazoG37] synthetase (radical SAM superfamily)
MTYIFGPVPSRRLGLSLGVDLIPPKTCTYDCLYCEVGKTTCHTIEDGHFIPFNEIARELELALMTSRPDTITLAGSGEPTLNSEIDKIISFIKERTAIKTAVLTNGSLFWKEKVLNKVLDADIILPTLSTVFEDTFRLIHRPCSDLDLLTIIKGLKELRIRYKGLIFLEVILLSGINDTEREIEGLKKAINEIAPDKVQINSVIRPPSDKRAKPMDMAQMEKIRDFLGDRAEIVAYGAFENNKPEKNSGNASVIEMARRRPIRLIDISNALNMTIEETEHLINEMLIKGEIASKKHDGETFYKAFTG